MTNPYRKEFEPTDVISAFLTHANKNGYDLMETKGAREAVTSFQRDALDPRPGVGWMYSNSEFGRGPFTWCVDSLISDVTAGGSTLMQWMPTETFTSEVEHVAHLSWIAPEGYDGTTDYDTYLNNIIIAECGCGPATDWNGFEYSIPYGCFCFETETLHVTDFGQRLCDAVPVMTLRGPNQGLRLQTDAEWAIARLGYVSEHHVDYVLLNGLEGGTMQWGGLMEILTAGYVAAHFVGSGDVRWADPLIVNGAGIANCQDLIETLKAMVNTTLQRAQDRNMTIATEDMVIVMPRPFWRYMLDCIACGGAMGCGVEPLAMNYADWRQERARAASGGMGFGVLDVDGRLVPVIPHNNMGVVNPGPPATATSDILILTRRVGGMTILEQQYLNYDMLNGWREAVTNSWTEQGGIMRVGWVHERQSCFSYFSEMCGRIVSRWQPFQARLTGVTVDLTLAVPEMEAPSFWNENAYVWDGQPPATNPLAPWTFS